MTRLTLTAVLLLGACTALEVPPEETPFYRQQLALARGAAHPAPPGAEASVLREAAASVEARGAAEAERIRRADDTEGLLRLGAPAAEEFLEQLSDPRRAESVLGSTPLDLERVLIAVHARNPDVAAARGNWAAAVRMYEQATYLEDLLLRYSAFTRLATPRVGAAPMREAAFPYPGLVALKGEMIDREVTMAREMTRMRLRDAMVAAAKAYHDAAYRAQELAVRTEQLSIAERLVAATRARVESGSSPQAELLEMEAERAMAAANREQADAAWTRARGELNSLLARAPDAPISLLQHADPRPEMPPLAPYLELAARYSPEARVARAEAGRTAAAIRMGEAMLFAAPSPGAVAPGAPMGGAMATKAAGPAAAAPEETDMRGPMGASSADLPRVPALAPRGAPPTGAPGAFGPDVAWVAELRERHAALERAAEEAARAAERRVIDAHYQIDAARRMFVLASKDTEPLSAQAVEERIRLYEAGRGEFAELSAAIQRRLTSALDAASARHEYGMAQAMLWMAAGARPEIVGTDSLERSPK